MGYLLKLNVSEIRIFMFGGVTKLKESLNLNIYKEILMLFMGPFSQIMFLIFVYYLYSIGITSVYTFEKFCNINMILLKFNLLPIIPLDGGKLLNNILDLIFPYELSHKITIIISIVSLPIIFMFDKKIFIIVMMLFLILNIIEEVKIHKYRLKKLLIERKLKNIRFKRVNYIKNIKEVKRNSSFKIYINQMYIDEKTYYENYFLISGT